MYGVYQNRTDYHTLPNMIERYYDNYNSYPLNLCADAGYGIYDNYRYLDEKKINNYVKYQNCKEKLPAKTLKDISLMKIIMLAVLMAI